MVASAQVILDVPFVPPLGRVGDAGRAWRVDEVGVSAQRWVPNSPGKKQICQQKFPCPSM